MKNSIDTMGHRTRNLPACSTVPQPSAPPRTPSGVTKVTHNRHEEFGSKSTVAFSSERPMETFHLTRFVSHLPSSSLTYKIVTCNTRVYWVRCVSASRWEICLTHSLSTVHKNLITAAH